MNRYRLRGQYLGRMQERVQIRHLSIDETELHPFDGTDLADLNAGAIEAMDDKVLALERGSGGSGTGQELPTIGLQYGGNDEFDVELEPCLQFRKVSASSLDADKSTLDREDNTTRQTCTGSRGSEIPHPFRRVRYVPVEKSLFPFKTLAGAPGFEPGNGGTKNRCLTTWRRPNRAGAV